MAFGVMCVVIWVGAGVTTYQCIENKRQKAHIEFANRVVEL